MLAKPYQTRATGQPTSPTGLRQFSDCGGSGSTYSALAEEFFIDGGDDVADRRRTLRTLSEHGDYSSSHSRISLHLYGARSAVIDPGILADGQPNGLCLASGQKQTYRQVSTMSAVTPIADMTGAVGLSAICQKRTSRHIFDHLVGAGE